MTVHPVILSGGAGSRLWPLSRRAYPKQLLPLVGERTLLEETLRRVAAPGFAAPTIVANAEHRFVIAEQARLAGVEPRAILLEPAGRNTAPAIAAAALSVAAVEPDAVLLVCPSDHLVRDVDGFRDCVARAAAAAAATGRFMTLGIAASRPETGFGWIERGEGIAGHDGCFEATAFREKPDLANATRLMEAGALWNGGIFLFPLAGLLDVLGTREPALMGCVQAALDAAQTDMGFCRLDGEAFGRARSVSIDHAVMEHAATVGVVPADFGWSDLGGFEALYEVEGPDAAGNVCHGDAVLLDSEGCHVRSSSRLVTVLGMRDTLVVETDDAVLVGRRERGQDIRELVAKLEKDGRREAGEATWSHRPWGYYRSVHQGERYQVKQIAVNPGSSLSLQLHHHRAEHWVVVRGTAKVECDGKSFLLSENQSCFIPLGTAHRLSNPGRIPLVLVEIQSGAYLGEDDIVRLEDHYGRS